MINCNNCANGLCNGNAKRNQKGEFIGNVVCKNYRIPKPMKVRFIDAISNIRIVSDQGMEIYGNMVGMKYNK